MMSHRISRQMLRGHSSAQMRSYCSKPLNCRLSAAPIIKTTCRQTFSHSHGSSNQCIRKSPTKTLTRALSTELSFPNQFKDFDFNNLVMLQHKAAQIYPQNPMFGTYDIENKKYNWITYEDFDKQVQLFRNVLKKHDIGVNDKVAIISNNRVEWAICKYAAVGIGAQIVPMYEAQLEKDWEYIVKDSEAKLVVAASESIYDRISHKFVGKLGRVQAMLCMDSPPGMPHSFHGWMKSVATEDPVPALVDIDPQHLAVVIYTSGTTGNPKGVELTHDNIVSVMQGANDLYTQHIPEGPETTLAYLPWSHIFGMTCELHSLSYTGSARAIVPNRDVILECLQAAKPTGIISVPVLFNKIYDGVMGHIASESSLKRSLVNYALKISRERNALLEYKKPVSKWLEWRFTTLDKIVLSKIRNRLGGRLRYMASGGAATSLTVLQFFEDIGVPIAEGYGLTETSPMITASSRDWVNRRLGCVGVPLTGVKVRIIDPENTQLEKPDDTDGEITCTGRNVMRGYRNNPDANDEVFYEYAGRRYFRTGDLGRMVQGKFLKVTGRIKEQFKLENGKYVVPAPLEDDYCRSPYISQCFICGDNKPYVVALIIPSWVDIAVWYKNASAAERPTAPLPTLQELADSSVADFPIFHDVKFQQLITSEFAKVGMMNKAFEKPMKWLPVAHPFSVENQMLTQKMSIKRNNVLSTYGAAVESMYTGAGNAVDY